MVFAVGEIDIEDEPILFDSQIEMVWPTGRQERLEEVVLDQVMQRDFALARDFVGNILRRTLLERHPHEAKITTVSHVP